MCVILVIPAGERRLPDFADTAIQKAEFFSLIEEFEVKQIIIRLMAVKMDGTAIFKRQNGVYKRIGVRSFCQRLGLRNRAKPALNKIDRVRSVVLDAFGIMKNYSLRSFFG